MISTAFINLAYYLLSLLTLPFPSSGGFSQETLDAFVTYGTYVTFVDSLVPMSILASSIALISTFELSVFAFKGLRWIVSHLPFVGGRG